VRAKAALVAAAVLLAAASSNAAPPALSSEKREAFFQENNRGAALMEQFKPAQALEAFARVVAIAPAWAPGQVNLGWAALYARQMERGEAAFEEAIRLDPALVAGHYGLATLEKGQGRSAEALAEFERARALDPDDPDILYNIGLLNARERRFKEAIEALKRARQIDPNSMSVRYQLARALLQSGDTAAGEKEMSEYARLAANPKFAPPTGNQYGEAGRYGLVITDYRAFEAPGAAQAVVRFSDASASSGLAFRHGGPGGEPQGYDARALGSGIAVGDLDGDGRPDLVLVNTSADGKARAAIFRNRGDGRFEDVTAKSGVAFDGQGLGAALGDYDNDGDLDLCLTRQGGLALYQNQGQGTFKDVSQAAHAKGEGLLAGASWGDFDHDGDLDLLVTRLSPKAGQKALLLLRNRGDGTFEDGTAALALSGGGANAGAIGAAFSDLDLDRDIDIVVSGAGGPDLVLDNRREAGFASLGEQAGLGSAGAGRGVVVGDVNGDGLPDLVFPSGPSGRPALYLGAPGKPFIRRDLPAPRGGSAFGAVLFDADNDGDLDLFMAGSAPLLLLNDGHGEFRDATGEAGLLDKPFKDGRGVAAADLDGDGDLDLVVSINGGAPVVLRNESASANRWVDVQPKGLNSNRQGVGTKVEVLAGSSWQRREIAAGSGYLSSSAVPLHVGLGTRPLADVVRLLWPGGVLQAELDVPAKERLDVQELDRKGSSCPLLFAWNGGRFGFVTDILGVGGLGLWMAPEKYVAPVPDEFVKIEANQLQPRDGSWLFQVVENLEEATYLDGARLMVIDAPKNVDVFPNEDFGGPDNGGPKLYAVEKSARILPLRATDDRGRDVTDKVLAVDRTYPDAFRKLSLAGYAEMHSLTLEFPEAVRGREGLVLFLEGWTEFEYSSSNYAAFQQDLTQTLPVLEMEDAEGQFRTVLPSIGFPPGLPRMIACDLRSLGALPGRRLRIRTNMQVYWDQIFLAQPWDESTFDDKVKVTEQKPTAAHLHKRGFPREHSPDGKEPRLYDYNILDNTQPFRLMSGDYTHYGRVTDLVTEADDRAVIFGRGEEVTLEFPVKGTPDPPKGTQRAYVLHVSGWCKDMDPHTGHGETIEPLPFRAMKAYPYADGESYPEDPALKAYRETWNTRKVEGR
jgi:Tfp pilus assembly protein PilF